MPIVTPLPLGGLATEIGTTQDRLQMLESLRLSQLAATTYPTTTVSNFGAQQPPSNWPAFTVTVDSTVGVLFNFSCNQAPHNPLSSSDWMNLIVNMDGNAITSNGAYVDGALGSGAYPNPLAINLTFFIPDGTYITGSLPMGDHTFELAMSVNVNGSTFTLSNASLMIWVL